MSAQDRIGIVWKTASADPAIPNFFQQAIESALRHLIWKSQEAGRCAVYLDSADSLADLRTG